MRGRVDVDKEQKPFEFTYNVRCPCCRESFDVNFSLTRGNRPPAPEWLDSMPQDIQDLIKCARDGGLIDAFENCWRKSNVNSNPPKRWEKVFFSWCRVAVPFKLSAQSALYFESKHSGSCSARQHVGVVGIFQGEQLREFTPASLLMTGSTHVSAGKVAVGQITQHHGKLDDWHRTRFGYLPADCQAIAAALRVRSIGEFAR